MTTRGTILVLTGDDDPTANAVIEELNRRGSRIARLDTGDFPIRLSFAASTLSGRWNGWLQNSTNKLNLNDIRSIYYRRPTRFRFPDGMSREDAAFATAEARLGLGGVLAALDKLWVNNPSRVAIAEYKPAQLHVAISSGLSVPRTYVGNDYTAAVEFARLVGGRVVCKTLSPAVLGDENGAPRITYTTVVDTRDIDPEAFTATAHQLQEWVPKIFEVRVTMVGRQPFGVAIHAASEKSRIDWRSDYGSITYRSIGVPNTVVAGMRRYLDRFDLAYGAFDFVVTPTEEWVMLECNPAGQWLWLEEEVGVPIAAALAELLTDGVNE